MISKIVFFILLTTLLYAIDYYSLEGLRTISNRFRVRNKKTLAFFYWLTSVLTYIVIATYYFATQYYYGSFFAAFFPPFLVLLYFTKLIVLPFLFKEDFLEITQWSYNKLHIHLPYDKRNSTQAPANHTLKFKKYRHVGYLSAVIPFVTMVYGVMKSAYNYKVKRVKLTFPELPNELEGFKVVQISDLHTGSFTSTKPIKEVVKLINEQNADLVCFTGDLVNFKSQEAKPFIKILKQIKAKHGVYSILGNHDYGDYLSWDTHAKKAYNMLQMEQNHQQMGWQLFRNNHQTIQKGNAKLNVIGMENWSAIKKFPNYGDMQKAFPRANNAHFNLLLSHDPTHWNKEITKYYKQIDLTLSGHTHGMQFGIDTRNFRWSPAKLLYKHWAGLYQKGRQKLYVNRGLGFIGFPGRVGVYPEITVLELSNSSGND